MHAWYHCPNTNPPIGPLYTQPREQLTKVFSVVKMV